LGNTLLNPENLSTSRVGLPFFFPQQQMIPWEPFGVALRDTQIHCVNTYFDSRLRNLSRVPWWKRMRLNSTGYYVRFPPSVTKLRVNFTGEKTLTPKPEKKSSRKKRDLSRTDDVLGIVTVWFSRLDGANWPYQCRRVFFCWRTVWGG